jgi:predicted DNA-binding transcriptional regulator YafY
MEAFPMPPVRLTDDELEAVMSAARPLEPWRRDAFLQEVANSLARCGELGPGIVHRVVAQVQHEFFDPPDLSRMAGTSKYR